MGHGNERLGGKYFVLFISFLVLYGTIIPEIYTVIYPYLESYYFTLNLVSPDSFVKGHWYALCATLLMLHAAYRCRPATESSLEIKRYESEHLRLRYILFYLATIALCTNILLDLFFGRSASNLTAQRPPIAVYLGYLAMGLSRSASLIILYALLLYKRLDRLSMLVILLTLVYSVSSASRAGIFDICFVILIGLAYSSADSSRISLKKATIVLMAGVIASMLGHNARGAQGGEVFSELLPRLYQNNQTLYLAIENQDKVYQILTEGQPRVLLQQLFSFAIERTEYPSAFRLLEYWGGGINETESGHIVGYAFGWLGLTFGLFGWYGLIAVYLFFLGIFHLLRACGRRPSLANVIFFSYFGGVLFESFGNLGLDSFAEKCFKGLLYAIVYFFFIRLLALGAGERDTLHTQTGHCTRPG